MMKTIRDAVNEGTLIDVTEAGKRAHLRCPVFLTAALWNGAFKRSEKELAEVLENVCRMYECGWGFDHYGPTDFDRYTATLEHDETLGQVMILSDFKAEHELDIVRVSGDLVIHVM